VVAAILVEVVVAILVEVVVALVVSEVVYLVEEAPVEVGKILKKPYIFKYKVFYLIYIVKYINFE
jgi:hypothetical protein